MDPIHLRLDSVTGEDYDEHARLRALALCQTSSTEFVLCKLRICIEILTDTKGRQGYYPRQTQLGLFIGFSAYARETSLVLPEFEPLDLFERFNPSATS